MKHIFSISLNVVGRSGSLEFDFVTGQTRRLSSRKYYQAHGCLMILGWIVLVPLGKPSTYNASLTAFPRCSYHCGTIQVVALRYGTLRLARIAPGFACLCRYRHRICHSDCAGEFPDDRVSYWPCASSPWHLDFHLPHLPGPNNARERWPQRMSALDDDGMSKTS